MTGGRALQQLCRPVWETLSPRQAVRRVVGASATSLGFVLCTYRSSAGKQTVTLAQPLCCPAPRLEQLGVVSSIHLSSLRLPTTVNHSSSALLVDRQQCALSSCISKRCVVQQWPHQPWAGVSA